ncbi:MAG: metallophosphoesterase [Pirellulales bacterium]
MTRLPAAPDFVATSRRAFLRGGALTLIAGGMAALPRALCDAAEPAARPLRIGLLTDLHYADKPPTGTRFYRETPTKLEEAAARFQREKLDFVVELGDLIDSADDLETEKSYLKQVNTLFRTLPGDKHYVLGNHCVSALTKDEFLGEVGAAGRARVVRRRRSAFRDPRRLLQLRRRGVWAEQLQVERREHPRRATRMAAGRSAQAKTPTIVFAHQRLDVKNDYGVKNAEAVRKILEASGRVKAVFQGHSHKNDLKSIAGIPYCTLTAMIEGSGVENNGYAILEITDDALSVSGFRKQAGYKPLVAAG